MKHSKLDIFDLLFRDSEASNIRLGINRIKKALKKLGSPCRYTPGIQIIGTNGKGSIASFLERILFISKLNVGVTTSPHLLDVRERIRINAEKIDKSDFKNLLCFVKDKVEEYNLTPFELIICCGIKFFDSRNVDLLILEAGLGGRLDATSAHLLRPIIAIGKIGFDHKEYLGETLEEITKEKVAVIEKNSCVVSCAQNKKVKNLINKKVKEVGAEIFWVQPLSDKWRIGLNGFFQKENAAVAVGVANILKNKGWDISEDNIKKGIAEAKWPGRLEIVNLKNKQFLVDAAHNPTAAEVLAKERKYWINEAKGVYWIIGVQKKKEIIEMLKIIATPFDKILLVPVPNQLSWELKDLENINDINRLNIIEFDHFYGALNYLENLEKWPDCNPVLTGSIFLVAEFIQYINRFK